MAFSFGFYNSVNGDRRYDALDFSRLADGLISEGIFADVGNALKVNYRSGWTTQVESGRAWFKYTWNYNDAAYILTHTASSVIYDRIDTVVLDINTALSARTNAIRIVQGTPADPAVAPTLLNGPARWQIPLANVFIAKGSTGLDGTRVTDRRGGASTPWVSPIVKAAVYAYAFTIPVSAWAASTAHSAYGYQATVAIPGATSTSLVRADFDLASYNSALIAEVAPAGDTGSSNAVFYAKRVPGTPLTGMYTIFQKG